MSQLLSFHNDKKIKQKYVARLKAHAEADEFIKGKYWEDGKGCAVGCTIHSNQHKAYETELGLPEWLARLEDQIFEGLSNENAKKFAVDFLLSIPVGKDLESVKWKFCSFVLKENLRLVQKLQISEELKVKVSEAIRGSLRVNESAIKNNKWDVSAWSAAESAAESAAWRTIAITSIEIFSQAPVLSLQQEIPQSVKQELCCRKLWCPEGVTVP